ncbi:MAG: hypothetical protein IT452_03420 [Planctomycetia bacterium]|nr:hypothetical protein [Planctomycetia bacterium]
MVDYLRRQILILLVSWVSLVTCGCSASGDYVSARRVEIPDRKGRVRITLGETGEDKHKIQFFDEKGRLALEFGESESARGALRMYDEVGNVRVSLEVTGAEVRFYLFDGQGGSQPRVSLDCSQQGDAASVKVLGSENRSSAVMEWSMERQMRFYITDEDGNVIWSSPEK